MIAPSTPTALSGDDLLIMERSLDEDHDEFRRLVEPHQSALRAHCYRMLGSTHDADDALQDALVRAWRSLHRFEGRTSLRRWLYTIATNTCLDSVSRRGRRAMPVDLSPSSERAVVGDPPLTEVAWPGRPLRAARSRRTGLRRRAAAPAGQPAGRAPALRGARLLRGRDRRDDEDLHGLGQQRAAAGPQDRGREGASTHPAADPAGTRR